MTNEGLPTFPIPQCNLGEASIILDSFFFHIFSLPSYRESFKSLRGRPLRSRKVYHFH